MDKKSKKEFTKLIMMLPLAVALQVIIIKFFALIFNWVESFNLFLALMLTFICMILASGTLGVIFVYYSGRYYNLILYTLTPVLLVCLYYVFFVYGITWISAFIILFPFVYFGGITHFLKNNFGYQSYISAKEYDRKQNESLKKMMDEVMERRKSNINRGKDNV